MFAIGNLEFGMLRHENDTTFTVDPGPTTLKVWYYANRGDAKGLFWQTDVMPMAVELKPNGRYQVRADYGDEEVLFWLLDLDTDVRVAQTESARIVRRPSPRPPSGVAIPIFIPSR